MKKQVVFVKGGTARENFESYLDFLKDYEYDPYEIKEKRWSHSLSDNLGLEYELLSISVPLSDFADYEEWKIMFDKVIPCLEDDVILVGHSLGGTFLVKYLNENVFPYKIKKIILVSAAFNDQEEELLGSFNFDHSLKHLKQISDKIFLFHSSDDEIVFMKDFYCFKDRLEGCGYKLFEDRGHFISESFPELTSEIKK